MHYAIHRLAVCCAVILAITVAPASAKSGEQRALNILHTWYRLTLELVRHTPTYSPPVASRSFAYLGVTAFEVVASGRPELVSLAGQLNGFEPPPARNPGEAYDEAVALQAAMAAGIRTLFGNTGPTGQRAIEAIAKKLEASAAETVDPDIAARSEAYGRAVAEHILAWSAGDGGASVENMGFPFDYELTPGPEHWVPTSNIGQQQVPLLPDWGSNRTFAMPDGATCGLPPPPEYSEDETSQFYKEALEVYEVSKTLTAEQEAIARFWSDDPMLTPTPPGHWLSIAMQVLEEQEAALDTRVEALARLGIGLADAFIGCWHDKFKYDLVRPVTYIQRTIDPDWQAILITPPFPEYPSGHSTQSGAAAEVLTGLFGENYAFNDRTHSEDGLPPRSFSSFWHAAEEAGISRLYGGIHYRAAIELGLDQGRCIAAYTNALVTRRQP
jgi:hypothetical protein